MLSDIEILMEMEKGNIVIDPYTRKQLHANSYDLCLGNWFIHLLGYKNGQPVFGNFFSVPDGDKVKIPNGGTLLAMTKEIAGSKHDLVPSVKTRSSIRRNGVDVCASAGLGDIGYINHWTVQLTGFVQPTFSLQRDFDTEAELVVGETFAQIVFERAGIPAEHPYDGQYKADTWPLCMLPKAVRDQYNVTIFGDFGHVEIGVPKNM